MPGTLYVLATPIGNLEDITLRALRLLKEVRLVAAEDTRVTRKLLSHYDIHTPLTSYHQHTRGEKAETIVARLLEGEDIALVSDAGLPGISDPGSDLVALALAQGITVTPVPGANAALSALVVSGLSTGRFAFEGFPPRGKTDRREFFLSLRDEPRTLVLYEAPGRLLETLEDLLAMLGDRSVAVARELTKLYEEVYRGTLTGAVRQFSIQKPRGEFTLVVGGAASAPASDTELAPDAVRTALQAALDAGATSRDAVQEVSVRLHLPRRFVYSTLLEMLDRH